MISSKYILLAKFGNKENLEQLQKGNIFFNTIQAYRNDGTNYRGDAMEGKIPIDPKTIQILDSEGKNIFEKIPYPDSVIETLENDENLMMFCSAAINENVLYKVGDNTWRFKEDFKNSISNFGEYVLLFYSIELLKNIELAKDINGQKIQYAGDYIRYRDLNDFIHTEEYRKTGSWIDRYFVKGLSYKNQNEWRVIIDGEREALKVNCGKGFLLKTLPFEYSMLMKTKKLLEAEITICEKLS